MEKKKFNARVFALIFLFCCLLIPFLNLTVSFTSAEETIYTNVLEDLQKDENFSIEDYPVIEKNYSLQLIQIAESEDQELFIYVYQPSGQSQDLRATEIRISTGIYENAKWVDYKLKFLNSHETLYKYKVENFELKKDALRYYDIPCIFRAWNKDLGDELIGDNVINYVSFDVGELWTLSTINNEIYYSCSKTKTISITGKYVGFIRYRNGFIFHEDACDSHFVAFSTDKPIDCLLKADVDFVTKTFKNKDDFGGGMLTSLDEEISQQSIEYEWGKPTPASVTINYDEEETIFVGNIIKKKYKFNRVEKVSDFLSNKDYDLTSIAKESLKDKQWVLRFTETDYHFKMTTGPFPLISENGTKVEEVSILRLKFETKGDVYDLGVVDNKQTGSDKPAGGTKTWWEKLIEYLLFILTTFLILFLLITLFPIIFPIVIWVFKVVIKIVWYILKGIWWVITLPLEIFKE